MGCERRDVAMLLTPPGAAAIAVVRLAGDGVPGFLARRFSARTSAERCVHGTLRDESGEALDDPVVVCSTDGRVADINVHGGAWVLESVLQLAERGGFIRAEAVAHPTIALDATAELEREVLERLPMARTELALRALLAQPGAWAKLVARVPSRAELQALLDDRSLIHLLNPPRVAIVGAPNVGKSTLANQLFGQDRSITADVPGTTRDWVGAIADVGGLAVRIIDTPGVRETGDAIEREAIERGGAEVRRADLVVLVLDTTRPLEPEQAPLLRAYRDAVRFMNKIDRPAAWTLAAAAEHAVRTVAATGQGVDRLRGAIKRHFGVAEDAWAAPRLWTARQREIVASVIREGGLLKGL